MSNLSLSRDEQETIISYDSSNNEYLYIYSSQQPMIKKLLRNPYFVIVKKRFNAKYKVYPEPISIEGFLPLRCLTIRSKLCVLSEDEVKKRREILKKAREKKRGLRKDFLLQLE
jgi:hypothetical protein